MKKLVAILLVVCSVFVISGCGSAEKTDKNANDLTGWDYIQDKGELVVGLDDTFAPMGFRDESNQLVGFDIDLANAVGEKLGVKIAFQPIDWDAKEMELTSKRIDCIWNGMSATEERQKNMALTKKYLNNRIVIFAKDDSVKINSVEDLAKYNIGTQADSSALEVMQANEAYDSFADKVSEYKTYDEAIMDMNAGRIDCIVVDEVLGEYKNSKMDKKMVLSDYTFGDDYYAIGCRQGENDVADKINEAIEQLIEDGTATEISNKWFGRDIVILEGYDNN
ncbi:amino acid ABC transporter substrate-binding protein [Clostridium aminobutyricum]|uniref:Amino acid ABC transporter substrate-binding protein n=1 Tax=Clostridium aminobutyricum TaxID=33953 RepID=A0A939D8B6_CLOAM|nr:amino acid ABC transporter substrate-binding protein [Clostridium aminobutyricum]MBN7773087.1 amino acid ABC transporter substrate-binding protein [Clostridium aminobutyricum]